MSGPSLSKPVGVTTRLKGKEKTKPLRQIDTTIRWGHVENNRAVEEDGAAKKKGRKLEELIRVGLRDRKDPNLGFEGKTLKLITEKTTRS